jgi:hypothetical protein
MDGE